MTPSVSVRRVNRGEGIMETLCWLENACKISYTLSTDQIPECSFRLPADDSKVEYLVPPNLIQITDHGAYIGLFRLAQCTKSKDSRGVYVDVIGQHVIGQLRDTMLFGAHQWTGESAEVILESILAEPLHPEDADDQTPKQSDWVLYGCDVEKTIDFAVENASIYEAITGMPAQWQEEVYWDYNTTTYPWGLTLKLVSTSPSCEIVSGKNLKSLTVSKNYEQICNRWYALGTGEGVNQTNLLNAEDLENPERPKNPEYYIEDAESIARYGVIEDILVDRSVSEPSILLMNAKARLSEYKDLPPVITAEAADVYPITGNPSDRFLPGAFCRVRDSELNIDELARIITVSKADILDKPGDVTLEISRVSRGELRRIYDLYRRDRTDKVVAQGSTNYFAYNAADNADKTHPVKITFRLPEDLLYVNACVLDFDVGAFRAYETGAASGGGTIIDMSTDVSSAAGGGQTIDMSTDVSSDSTSDKQETSGEVVTDYQHNPNDPAHPYETSTYWDIYKSTGRRLEPYAQDGYGNWISPVQMSAESGSQYTQMLVYQHSHPHYHIVTIRGHKHKIYHTHKLPLHSHKIYHTHNLDAHTHNLLFGIYEKTASVSGVTIRVDGNLVGGVTGISGDGIDIIDALTKGTDGKVTRGKHTITITPQHPSGSQQALCRIDAQLHVQCFIQSRGKYRV